MNLKGKKMRKLRPIILVIVFVLSSILSIGLLFWATANIPPEEFPIIATPSTDIGALALPFFITLGVACFLPRKEA
ncbi:MAG: hypothetical protein WC323_03445 [Patescibacteria group bacterium]|jgi:flagellar basal body-associated protein FliL